MLWAIKDGKRVLAEPKGIADCPLCKETLIPKCGEIKRWHWSHRSDKNCDVWYEPETKWHSDWKNKFPKNQQEVVMKKDYEKHIADIQTKKGFVIELQASPISAEDITIRENFYGYLIWILNYQRFAKNLELRPKENYYSFRWRHPPKSWWVAKCPIYIDITKNDLFLVKKIYPKCPCGGWGIIISKDEFMKKIAGKKDGNL